MAAELGRGVGCASRRLRGRGCVCGASTGVSEKLAVWWPGPGCGPGRGGLIARGLPGAGGAVPLTSPPLPGESMRALRGPRLPAAGILLALPLLPLLLLPAAPAPRRASYKPVIVVHGLFDSSYSFRHLLDYINEVRSGRGRPVAGRWGRPRWLGRERAQLKAAPLGLPGSSELVLRWGAVGRGETPAPAGHTVGIGAARGGLEGFAVHPPAAALPLPADAPWDCGHRA